MPSSEVIPPHHWYAEFREDGAWQNEAAADELVATVNAVAGKLEKIEASEAGRRPAPGKWSIKEILGHLVDSASNNHQRFVRAQSESVLVSPGYGQDFWVDVQGYAESPWPDLVTFWRLYNLHLAQVMRRVPKEKLEVTCRIGSYEPVPLGFVIEDYVAHVKHHLRQIDALAER